jgi:maleate cis-trans isomerase
MVAHGADGTLNGLEGRIQSQVLHLDESTDLLAAVKPDVIVLAHTATCYRLGRAREASIAAQTLQRTGVRFVTVLQSAMQALSALDVQRVALATPYDEALTRDAKAGIESYGIEVVSFDWLRNVRSVFDETPARAYRLGRSVDRPEAQAVFFSGVGMPTVSMLQALERDIGKPVISSASAMMWNALCVAGVEPFVPGYGRLLSGGVNWKAL